MSQSVCILLCFEEDPQLHTFIDNVMCNHAHTHTPLDVCTPQAVYIPQASMTCRPESLCPLVSLGTEMDGWDVVGKPLDINCLPTVITLHCSLKGHVSVTCV